MSIHKLWCRWRECDCGHEHAPTKFEYNTKCGHAIDCHWYLSAGIRDLAQPEPPAGTTEKIKESSQ